MLQYRRPPVVHYSDSSSRFIRLIPRRKAVVCCTKKLSLLKKRQFVKLSDSLMKVVFKARQYFSTIEYFEF